MPDPLPFVVGFALLSLELSPVVEPSGVVTIFFKGTGVDEADDRPLLGLVGSFFE